MNNANPIRFGENFFILLLFSFVGCTTQRSATSTNDVLIPVSKNVNFSDDHEVRVDFTGLKNGNYEFSVFIQNNSEDPIFVNPDLFRYRFTSETKGTNKDFISSINPDEKMKQLKIQKDSLENIRNPFSLADKSVGEIATEGLAEGTVAVLFGQNAEELEEQREEDEFEWEQNRLLHLQKINEEIDFWNNRTVFPDTIPPKKDLVRSILFPLLTGSKELILEIPLQNRKYEFRFKKANFSKN